MAGYWAAGAEPQSAPSSAGSPALPLLRRANRGRAAIVITSRLAINSVATERESRLRRSIARQRLRRPSQLPRLRRLGWCATNWVIECCFCVKAVRTATVGPAYGLESSSAKIENAVRRTSRSFLLRTLSQIPAALRRDFSCLRQSGPYTVSSTTAGRSAPRSSSHLQPGVGATTECVDSVKMYNRDRGVAS